MFLNISKETTPVLYQQAPEIQKLCQQVYGEYHGQKSVEIRLAEGQLFEGLRRGKLKLVDENGEPTTEKATLSAICEEMNVPRSTAYNYADEYIVTQGYPEPIQNAAKMLNLNLANPKIQQEYERLKGDGEIPSDLDALRAEALVARIKKATRTKGKGKKPAMQRFEELLKEAFEIAEDEELNVADIRSLIEAQLQVVFPASAGWTIDRNSAGQAVGVSAAL